MPNPIDLTGHKYGRLTVKEMGHRNNRRRSWLCLCDCGKTTFALAENLRSGNTISCGCLRRETIAAQNARHGYSREVMHNLWCAMRQRCENPSNGSFANYGGRGIKVCERWQVFENFLEDMGSKPSPKHSIDRINVNDGYNPPNCRWATRSQQARNTRLSKIIDTPSGPMQINDAAEFFGIPASRLSARVYNGLPKEVWFAPNLRDWRNHYNLPPAAETIRPKVEKST